MMRTAPESQARTTKKSAALVAMVLRPRFRVRRERRRIIGIRARVMRDQSRAMKPAFGKS